MNKNDFITIMTFTYPTDAAIIRGRLEAEGIMSVLQDELTVQVHPFSSNAIGGVKLQVLQNDAPAAIEILKSAGYIKPDDEKPSKIILWLDRFLSKFRK